MQSTMNKSILLIGVVLVFVATTFSFAVFHNEDGTDTVAFLLNDQYGQKQTHKDLSDKPLLVFFGFTSCDDICPLGLHTLSNVINKLKQTEQHDDIRTVMITVDPERDTAERMNSYLAGFNKSFIGLRGTRAALENAAAEFNTFLDKPPEQEKNSHSMHDHGGADFIDSYQLTHSSVVYLVDTYSRVVGHISLNDDVDSIVKTIRKHLEKEAQRHG